MATNLTEYAQEGFDAHDLYCDWRGSPDPACKHYFSSDAWLAYQAGSAMFSKGVTRPTAAFKSRGYSVRLETASGTKFVFKAAGEDLEKQDLDRA